MRRLIIGCGYLGERAARFWLSRGDRVAALTRSPERAGRFAEMGMEPFLGDVMQPETLTSLPEVDTCLYAVGFDRSGVYEKRAVSVTGLRNALSELSSRIGYLIHISSTSVYGQSAGEWVNEDSPCAPCVEGGRVCLEAEDAVCSFFRPNGGLNRGTILRLAGIYGPGRLIGRADQLLRREPMTGSPEAWLNLIHVDDAVAAIGLLADGNVTSKHLLLSDERPLRRHEFYGELARLLGAPTPVFAPTTDPSLNKRCDSSRIRRELSYRLMYPSAFEGLPHALQSR